MVSVERRGWNRRNCSIISWTSIAGGWLWRRQGSTRVTVAMSTTPDTPLAPASQRQRYDDRTLPGCTASGVRPGARSALARLAWSRRVPAHLDRQRWRIARSCRRTSHAALDVAAVGVSGLFGACHRVSLTSTPLLTRRWRMSRQRGSRSLRNTSIGDATKSEEYTPSTRPMISAREKFDQQGLVEQVTTHDQHREDGQQRGHRGVHAAHEALVERAPHDHRVGVLAACARSGAGRPSFGRRPRRCRTTRSPGW